MRKSGGRLVVLGAIIASSSALVHCVSDEPATGVIVDEDGSVSDDGSAGGGDGSTSTDGSPTGDGSTLSDGGTADACTSTPCNVEVSAGGAHSCARATDGVVRCWGANHFGELGSGSVFPSGTAADPSVVPNMSVPPLVVPGLAGVTVLGTGGSYAASGMSCANLASGKVQCWGLNAAGNLGRGSSGTAPLSPKPAVPAPADVVTITNAISLGAGVQNACAVLQGGSVACWGSYDLGALNQTQAAGSWTGSPAVITLAAGAMAKKVAIAGEHVCVLTTIGGVQCWGENSAGSNGPPAGTSIAVTAINLPESAVDVDVGREFSCAVGTSGATYCWGESGHLGRNPSETANDPSPGLVALPTGTKAVQIASGSYHSCVLTSDSKVYCWGGLVGTCVSDGTDAGLPGASKMPVEVTSFPAKPVHIDGGHCHMCALLEGGAVACWGKSHDGELGRSPETEDQEIIPKVVAF